MLYFKQGISEIMGHLMKEREELARTQRVHYQL